MSDYARSRNYPVTHLLTCTYFSNITRAQQLQKKEDGSFLLRMPIPDDCELPSFAAEQIGLWVRAALANPTRYVGSSTFPLHHMSPTAHTTRSL